MAFLQHLIDSALTGLPIQRVGVSSKLDTFEQRFDVARHSVRGHDQRRVECVDVFAGDRSFGVTDQGCNRDLSEPQIISDARETVPQDMRRHVP